MTKKLLCLSLAIFMLMTVMAGCTKTTTKEVWLSYSDYEDAGAAGIGDEGDTGDEGDATGNNDSEKTTTQGKRTKTTAGKKTTQATGKRTRAPKSDKDSLDFTPVADAGANYNVSGKVSIAVDTVRPTDYDAMFDILLELYPNIEFEFDYWTHSTNDDGREYLTKNMATGTAAYIMWDEAGEIPTYIMNGGWIRPITDYVAKDPEAKYIPANIKADYTYYGELFAVPHQATFETVAFNTELVSELGMKKSDLPGLEWTMDEYEELLKKGAAGWRQKKCVAIATLFEAHNRSCFWDATANGAEYGNLGYNYATGQIDIKYMKQGASQMRRWREIIGVEGWFHRDELNSVLGGVAGHATLWGAGKALMQDTLTVYTEKWDDQYPDLEWMQWTTPNRDGNMMMHIDHCFITSTTPDSAMDACYQALRFMTFTTNGNLARLTMYEDSEAGKYNLNSHVYHLTTTSPTAVEKFNKLSCTDEVDEYLVANIKNSSRYDAFKIVPGAREAYAFLTQSVNNITDGLDDGAGLDEPAVKANAKLKEYQTLFKQAFDKYYK